jgi:hypothetical protein
MGINAPSSSQKTNLGKGVLGRTWKKAHLTQCELEI